MKGSGVIIFCIVMFLFLDFLLIMWISKINGSIKDFQSNESGLCPLFFCDQIIDPSSGDAIPGSYCYTNTSGPDNVMSSYRYGSDNTTTKCQGYNISDNIIITDQVYKPESDL